MGKSVQIAARLVRNLQLRITQTNCVGPRQMLDAALLVPAVSDATEVTGKGNERNFLAKSKASDDFTKHTAALERPSDINREDMDRGSSVSPIAGNLNISENVWSVLETHAMIALPNLSPAGILQFLFLALRGNFHPKAFLEELQRFLLQGEPVAPPVDAFWRLWTANDLALLYKALVKHRVIDELLFAEIRSHIALNLPHFGPSDVAVVLGAAAENPESSLTLALLEPLKLTEIKETIEGTSGSPVETALAVGFSGRCMRGNLPHKFIADLLKEGGDDGVCLRDKAPPLFVLLLAVFARQLHRATVNDCVRVFVAASQVYGGISQAVPLKQPPSEIEGPVCDCDTISAAWKASLGPVSLLARHLKRSLVTASPRASLRMVAGGVKMWRLLKHPGDAALMSLHAAVAEALDNADGAGDLQTAENQPESTIGDGKKKSGGCDPLSNPLENRYTLTFVRSKLFWFVDNGVTTTLGGARSLDPTAKQHCVPSEAIPCEAAVRDMLASAIPAVCSSPADLSPVECMVLLESLWQLHRLHDFAIPFSWVEGFFFFLSANLHQLSFPQVLALTSCLELCLRNDAEKQCHNSMTEGTGASVQHIQKQRQRDELANLIRHRIHTTRYDCSSLASNANYDTERS